MVVVLNGWVEEKFLSFHKSYLENLWLLCEYLELVISVESSILRLIPNQVRFGIPAVLFDYFHNQEITAVHHDEGFNVLLLASL